MLSSFSYTIGTDTVCHIDRKLLHTCFLMDNLCSMIEDTDLCKHLCEVFGGRVVTSLLQVGLDLVLDLSLVQVPRVLLLCVLPGRRVRSSGNLRKFEISQGNYFQIDIMEYSTMR